MFGGFKIFPVKIIEIQKKKIEKSERRKKYLIYFTMNLGQRQIGNLF